MAANGEDPRRTPGILSSTETLLIETLRQQLFQVQQEQTTLRANLPGQLDAIRREASLQGDQARLAAEAACERLRKDIEGRLTEMDKEIEEIRKDLREIKNVDLRELKDAIIGNQSDNYKRIIGAQAAILIVILSAAIGFFFQFIHH